MADTAELKRLVVVAMASPSTFRYVVARVSGAGGRQGTTRDADADLIAKAPLLAQHLAAAVDTLRAIAGSDPEGFEGFHFVGDEHNPAECPGCVANTYLSVFDALEWKRPE